MRNCEAYVAAVSQIMQIKIPGVAPAKPQPRMRPASKGEPPAEFKRGPPAGPPMNVDDIVVGGGSAGGGAASGPLSARGVGPVGEPEELPDRFLPSGGGSSKRAIKREPLSHPNMDDRIGMDDDMSDLPITERPIRPTGSSAYMDAAVGGIDDDPNAFQGGGGIPTKKSMDHFPPGEHPLEGVPNFSDLPAPEGLSGKSREAADSGGIAGLVGEYRARCLFSKTWILREAALTKINLMLQTEFSDSPGIDGCLGVMAAVIKVGIEDKIQQVLFSSLALLESTLKFMRRYSAPRSTATVATMDIIIIYIPFDCSFYACLQCEDQQRCRRADLRSYRPAAGR